jgi:ankyrin repeat protein
VIAPPFTVVVNKPDDGCTLLMQAAAEGNVDRVKALIAAGANIEGNYITYTQLN